MNGILIELDKYNEIKEHLCCNGCCTFRVRNIPLQVFGKSPNYKKAGAFIIDPSTNRIVLVKGKYADIWGIPKGSVEADEDVLVAAMREVKEETGIELTMDDLKEQVMYGNEQIFKVERKENKLVPADVHDAVGVVWIKLDCLILMMSRNDIKLNYLTKKILKKIYGFEIDDSKKYKVKVIDADKAKAVENSDSADKAVVQDVRLETKLDKAEIKLDKAETTDKLDHYETTSDIRHRQQITSGDNSIREAIAARYLNMMNNLAELHIN
jgi:hypothetical protein